MAEVLAKAKEPKQAGEGVLIAITTKRTTKDMGELEWNARE